MKLWEFAGKQIRIKTISGRIFEGLAQDYTSELDSPSGIACISIGNIEFEENEISGIEILTADTPVLQQAV